MDTVIIALMILSGLMLLTGFVWIMWTAFRTEKPSVEKLSDEEAARIMFAEDEDEPGEMDVAGFEAHSFKGKGVGMRAESEVSFAQIEEMIRSGRWQDALPWLLAIGGLLGLVVLIGPLLWFVAGNKIVAAFWMLATLWALVNMGRSYIRGGTD